MPRLTKLSIEEAESKKVTRKKKGKVQEEYTNDILSLKAGESGKYSVKTQKEAFAVRIGLKRAFLSLGFSEREFRIKKVSDEIFFWKTVK